jgi:hypothetical protein
VEEKGKGNAVEAAQQAWIGKAVLLCFCTGEWVQYGHTIHSDARSVYIICNHLLYFLFTLEIVK